MQKPSWKCKIGWHRWEWRAVVSTSPSIGRVEEVQCRCKREGCTRYQIWKLAHSEHIQEKDYDELADRAFEEWRGAEGTL